VTATTRAAPRRTISSGSGCGSRQAMPSAKVNADCVGTGWPAANDSAKAGAFAATTPTISAVCPNASRAAIIAQMPLPSPIGT